MTVGGGRRGEVVAAPAAMNLTGALQASAPFSFFLANRAVAATGWPEKSNGSAVADPLAGERLRPCASAPPSSGFAAVLEPAREHPPPDVPVAKRAAPISAPRRRAAARV